ncbi:uncharacterized protein [Narcine bancroftii]|uniref:uncharacterized protein n=1 Tax=Narcine bancroftii TaxID=1343680 RepID=UPI003831D74B
MLTVGLWLWAATTQATYSPPVVLRWPFGVRCLLDSAVRYTCLRQPSLELEYEHSPGTDTSGPVPTLCWFVSHRQLATAQRWADCQNVVQMPPEVAVTLRYSSVSCPDCSYWAAIIYTAPLLTALFFLMLGQVPIILQDVPLAWCTNLLGSAWTYRLSCPGATPSSTSLAGDRQPSPSGPCFQKLLSEDWASEVMFDWSSESLTGNSISYESLNPLSLVHLVDERYSIELNGTTFFGSQSLSGYDFYINFPPPPMDGRCVITPKYG